MLKSSHKARVAPSASHSMQSKTKELRQAVLIKAAQLFSGLGYDAISLATIEAAAQVPKNVIPYHFGSKPNLWRACADYIFAPVNIKMDTIAVASDAPVDPKRFAALFVEMSAESPEVAQMIFQEAKTESWRLDYLVTQHTRPLLNKIEKALGRRISPNQYYFLVGAGSAPFTARYECMALFGTDPQDKAFIDAHKATLTGLVEGENS